jgi:thymidylate synthase
LEPVDQQYQNLVTEIMMEGTNKPSRAGDTRSIFDYTMKFDLRDGFPLLSTKKIVFDNVYAELMWFLRGDSNIKTLRAPQLWKPWANEDGDCGRIYGVQFRRWEKRSEDAVVIKKRDAIDASPEPILKFPLGDRSIPDGESSGGSPYAVIGDLGVIGKNTYYRIQFLDTGSIVEVSRPNLRVGLVLNPHFPSVSGVGYYGNPGKHQKNIYTLWRNMIVRCYQKDHPSYKFYGERGVTVCTEWHSFERFLLSISKVPYYSFWKEEPSDWQLDKDYFGANQYGPNTCLFEHKSTHGSSHAPKGYEDIELASVSENELVRPLRVIDQMSDLIDKLKTNPNDRRMIVTAWNPGELQQMALPCCHMFFQCYVSDGYLDLSMWQRSCDVAIGVPYNIASYALLLMMLAKETNFTPRFFNHHLGDAHIYTHHFDGLKKQLARESKVMPRLFLDYKDCMLDAARRDSPDDYVLENYDPAPFIKFSLNV